MGEKMSEVRRGYKQTEVGVIPEDWEAGALGPHVDITSGDSPSRFRMTGNGIPYFKVEQLNNDGRYLLDTPYRIDSVRRVVRGSLIFPKRGASILLNKIRILAEDSFMDTNLMALTVKPSLHSEFLYYALAHVGLWRVADITSIPQINNKHIKPLLLPLPPTHTEQTAIAEALSDADALIESLEQLLTKKRQIKQGAMQDLLTGKERLPGFDGSWARLPLGEIAHIKTGGRNNQDKVDDGKYPFFVRSPIVERIDTYAYECEAILVPGEGNIGNIFHYVSGRFDVHQRVYAITDFIPEVCGRYVHLYMSMRFGAHAMQNTVKATVDSLRLPTFQNFLVLLPPTFGEQTAIATILSDMDADIATLENKLTKAQQIKQGMMQELLTGRIRLV
jgi:type I restriction enzyme S subunit